MNKALRKQMEKMVIEFLSQYCIAPGTPHWLAGERDFCAGFCAASEIYEAKLRELLELQKITMHSLTEIEKKLADSSQGGGEK